MNNPNKKPPVLPNTGGNYKEAKHNLNNYIIVIIIYY